MHEARKHYKEGRLEKKEHILQLLQMCMVMNQRSSLEGCMDVGDDGLFATSETEGLRMSVVLHVHKFIIYYEYRYILMFRYFCVCTKLISRPFLTLVCADLTRVKTQVPHCSFHVAINNKIN